MIGRLALSESVTKFNLQGSAKTLKTICFGDVRIGSLLFADDVVKLTSSDRDLHLSLEHFIAECDGH